MTARFQIKVKNSYKYKIASFFPLKFVSWGASTIFKQDDLKLNNEAHTFVNLL